MSTFFIFTYYLFIVSILILGFFHKKSSLRNYSALIGGLAGIAAYFTYFYYFSAISGGIILTTLLLLFPLIISFSFLRLRKSLLAKIFIAATSVLILISCYSVLTYQLVVDSPLQLSKSGELLVRLDENADTKSFHNQIQHNGWTAEIAFTMTSPERTRLDNYFIIDLPDDIGSVKDKVEIVKKINGVEFVEYNESISLTDPSNISIEAAGTPSIFNDPLLSEQWSLSTFNYEKYHDLLNKVPNKRKTLLVILDSGVESDHEDLSDVYKVIDNNSNSDKLGHGTHCAGIAAAITNNEKGISSLNTRNNRISLSSIKVLSDRGIGSQSRIIQGIISAVDKGADVISMSLGAPSIDKRQRAYTEAVEYAHSKGAVVVVAAGNAGKDSRNYTPANVEGVITVTAMDNTSHKADFGNDVSKIKYGLCAPGVDIQSTYPNGKYKALTGSSMAAPYVASIVSILKSVNPSLTTKEIYTILNQSGKTTLSGSESGKLVNPVKALEYFNNN